MATVRKGCLPGSEAIVTEAFEELGYVGGKVSPEDVKNRFDQMLHDVWIRTLEVLERYERKTYEENIADELMKVRSADFQKAEAESRKSGFAAGIRVLFARWYPYLVEAFLSISQSRKQRGGKDFELQFATMLTLMQLPYERIDRKYRVDFILPNSAFLAKNRTRAMIASAKRTLRERWREVVEELHNTRAPNIYLITADSDVTQNHVKAICHHYNIFLVVWDEVKEQRFPDEALVLGYTTWAKETVPEFRRFWK